MANIIEEFYYGNLEPQESKTHLTAVMKAKLKELTKKEEQLNGRLSDAEKEMLRDYSEAYNEFLCMSCADSFIAGFRYGARFVYDSFVAG